VTEGWNPTNQTLFEFCPNGAWWPFRFSCLLESAVTPTKYIQPHRHDMSSANRVRKREGKCPRGSYTRQCPSSLLHTTNGSVSPWIILRGRSKHITSTKLLYHRIDALSRSDSDISVIGILLCNCDPVISAIANENELTVTSLHSPSSAMPDDVPTPKEICVTGEFCAPTRRCYFTERIKKNGCKMRKSVVNRR